ncbi:hypothetical protein CCACVL1_11934 [Corchorus capsularis]|uniref:Uncharacterized protein n=1 Tax=Corchorus capsularis TaxID=210143 RepID=A0A1R3IIW6_COCAP|nr:hypothetical protein CCACVL1_11934 [Corchorus capsularis]
MAMALKPMVKRRGQDSGLRLGANCKKCI